MSSYNIRKLRKSLSILIVKSSFLLTAVLIGSTDISSYFNYINRGFSSYKMSPLEFSRCIRCVQSNRSEYDVIGVISSQF